MKLFVVLIASFCLLSVGDGAVVETLEVLVIPADVTPIKSSNATDIFSQMLNLLETLTTIVKRVEKAATADAVDMITSVGERAVDTVKDLGKGVENAYKKLKEVEEEIAQAAHSMFPKDVDYTSVLE